MSSGHCCNAQMAGRSQPSSSHTQVCCCSSAKDNMPATCLLSIVVVYRHLKAQALTLLPKCQPTRHPCQKYAPQTSCVACASQLCASLSVNHSWLLVRNDHVCSTDRRGLQSCIRDSNCSGISFSTASWPGFLGRCLPLFLLYVAIADAGALYRISHCMFTSDI